jgi:hypothetical protein
MSFEKQLVIIGGVDFDPNNVKSDTPDLVVKGGAKIKKSIGIFGDAFVKGSVNTDTIKPKTSSLGLITLDGDVEITGILTNMGDSVIGGNIDAELVCAHKLQGNILESKGYDTGNAMSDVIILKSPLIVQAPTWTPKIPLNPALGTNPRNIFFGYNSGIHVGESLYNVFNINDNGAYYTNYNVRDNVCIGYRAMENVGKITSYRTNDCVAIGSYTMRNTSYSQNSIVIGSRSAIDCNVIKDSTIIGSGILTNQAIGYVQDCVVIGNFRNKESPLIPITDPEPFDRSIIIGYNLLNSVNNSNGSVAIGLNLLSYQSTTTGQSIQHSVFIGGNMLRADITGSIGDDQIGIGYGPFSSAATLGAQQIAIGYGVFRSGSSGARNIAIGTGALNKPGGGTSFSECIAIGTYAGDNLLSGSNNIIIGQNADPSSQSVSNEITLGNGSIATLRCQQTTITALSDQRDKADIQDLELGIEFIKKIRPVQFKWNRRDWYEDGDVEGSKKDTDFTAGFIAQELQQVQADTNTEWMKMVLETNPDRLEATPGKLLFPLIKAVQELIAQNEQLRIEVELLKE